VFDTDGNAIEGATVSLENKDGLESFSETTDADGEISAQDVKCYLVEHEDGGGAYDNTQTLYSPFTLRITAPGYRTYESVMDIDSKQELTISLKRISVQVDQEMM
jgi:hypothetical protein